MLKLNLVMLCVLILCAYTESSNRGISSRILNIKQKLHHPTKINNITVESQLIIGLPIRLNKNKLSPSMFHLLKHIFEQIKKPNLGFKVVVVVVYMADEEVYLRKSAYEFFQHEFIEEIKRGIFFIAQFDKATYPNELVDVSDKNRCNLIRHEYESLGHTVWRSKRTMDHVSLMRIAINWCSNDKYVNCYYMGLEELTITILDIHTRDIFNEIYNLIQDNPNSTYYHTALNAVPTHGRYGNNYGVVIKQKDIKDLTKYLHTHFSVNQVQWMIGDYFLNRYKTYNPSVLEEGIWSHNMDPNSKSIPEVCLPIVNEYTCWRHCDF